MFLTAALILPGASPGTIKAPETKVRAIKETIHGVEIVDPYRWLEDQSSPETRAWIESQNGYARPILDGMPGRAALEKRLGELLKIDSVGMPQVRNGRYFFSKRAAGQDLAVLYFRRRLKGNDEVLLDPHPLSSDHTISATLWSVSNDGTLAICAIRQGGEDEIALRLIEVDTRKELPDRFPKARYWGASLTPDKRGLYHTRFEQEGPRVFYHALGTDTAQDRRIFGDGLGRDKTVGSGFSDDGRYFLIVVSHGVADASKPMSMCRTA